MSVCTAISNRWATGLISIFHNYISLWAANPLDTRHNTNATPTRMSLSLFQPTVVGCQYKNYDLIYPDGSTDDDSVSSA